MLIFYIILLGLVLLYAFINVYHAIRYASDLDGRVPWGAITIYVLIFVLILGVSIFSSL